MHRFRLRTLLIVLAIGPMVLAWWVWPTLQPMLWQSMPTAPAPVVQPAAAQQPYLRGGYTLEYYPPPPDAL